MSKGDSHLVEVYEEVTEQNNGSWCDPSQELPIFNFPKYH